MEDLCIIKYNSGGLQLILNPDCDFMELIEDICYRFLNSKEIFGDIHTILQIHGRELTSEETRAVVESIELNSNVKVLLVDDGDSFDAIKESVDDKINKFYCEKAFNNAKILKGDVDEDMHFDRDVVVLGDVKRGCTLNCDRSVIVLGSVYGEIEAGLLKDESSYIIASDFESDNISLCKWRNPELFEKKGGLFNKKDKKGLLKCVCIFQGEMIMEPLENGILF